MSASVVDDRAVRFLDALEVVPEGALAHVRIRAGEIIVSPGREGEFRIFRAGHDYTATFPKSVEEWNNSDMHKFVGTVFQRSELYVIVAGDITVFYRT